MVAPSLATSAPSAATPSPSEGLSESPVAVGAETARATALAYETDRAGGNWEAAWTLLAPYSQHIIGSLAEFQKLEQAYNKDGGSIFKLADPTRDEGLFSQDFLGDAYVDVRDTGDINRAWLVFVDHPNVRGASASQVGLLVAPVGEQWLVWIAH